jgi:uncharacterized protein involved in outer membrane biogenesis
VHRRESMKRLIAILAGLLVILALAVFLLPHLIPASTVKRHLGPLLAETTGLQLQDARGVRLSLIPAPAVAFEGVRATLPVNEASAPQVSADRIVIAIRPSALFERRLELEKITFVNPSLVLDPGALKQSEWAPGRSYRARVGRQGAEPALIKAANRPRRAPRLPTVDIAIINGSLSEADDQGQGAPVSDANLVFSSNRAANSATLEGSLRLKGELVNLSAQAERSQERRDGSMALRAALHSEGMRTELDGALIFDAAPRFAGSARVEMTAGPSFATMIGVSAKLVSRFEGAGVSGHLEISDERIALSDGTLTAPGAKGDITILARFDGATRVTLKNLALHGGTARGVLTLDMRQPEAILAGSFSMANVDALALTRGVSDFDWLSGRANAEIELAGGGRTADAIAETLKGQGKLSIADGAIEGLDLPLIVADVREGEFGKWRREAGRRTPFDRLAATFTVEDGVTTTKDLSLTGPNITVTGEGRTNIPRGRIKYRLKTKITATDGDSVADPQDQQAAFSIPLIVKGDWEKPDIYPDLENAVEDSESLRGTAKLFGKSVEKLTDGQIKADDFGKVIDGLFGKKKKRKRSGNGGGED